MSDPRVWLIAAACMPIAIVYGSLRGVEVERLRRLAVVAATAMLLASFALAASPHTLSIRTSALSWTPGGEALVRVDSVSSVLLPLAAGLWLLTVAVTPRASLDRGGLRRMAIATLVTFASFLTESAAMLLLLSTASLWTVGGRSVRSRPPGSESTRASSS